MIERSRAATKWTLVRMLRQLQFPRPMNISKEGRPVVLLSFRFETLTGWTSLSPAGDLCYMSHLLPLPSFPVIFSLTIKKEDKQLSLNTWCVRLPGELPVAACEY